jgi:hypothetical protein
LYSNSLAAAVPVSMSASLNGIPWSWLIGFPNAMRSLAYAFA